MRTMMIVLALAAVAAGKTIHVPGDYPTIQSAVDVASNGDTVLVHPGTYDPVHMTYKAITVKSANGPYSTTIKGDPMKFPVVKCGSGFVLDGFSVTNGYYYGGIVAAGSTIRHCIVYSNHSEMSGGGLEIDGSTTLVNNIIHHNKALDVNSGGERGGGIEIVGSGSPILTNNTICFNESDWGGGICCSNNATPIITNCIVWKNTATQSGDQIHGSGSVVTYSVVEGGWPGTGNMTSDPHLGPDFHIPGSSPCIDLGFNGAPAMPTLDIDGDLRILTGTVDIGADENTLAISLTANTTTLSAQLGGSVSFHLYASCHGGQDYVMLMSVSGSSPGTKLPGGQIVLPINWDAMTEYGILTLNTPYFLNFLGKLSAAGTNSAMLNVPFPLPSSCIGVKITFAYALYNPWNFASTPVEVEITY